MNNDKSTIIKKYPYLGSSPNLIDYFSIIGYSENCVKLSKELNKSIDSIKPEILSSMISKNTL